MMVDQKENDVLWGMLQQEQKTYLIMRRNRICRPTNSCDLYQRDDITEYRYNMVDWCFRMVDFCHLNRETVAIAMNFIDRFVIAEKGKSYLSSTSMYQLAAVTALYTAVKIHEIQAIDLQSMSNISKGIYSTKKVEEVEREMLDALHWKMNPPTAMSFVRCFVDAISHQFKLSPKLEETILELSRIQTESAVFDEELIECKMSTIGYCSLINALNFTVNDPVILHQITHVLGKTLNLPIFDRDEVAQIQNVLLCSSHPTKNSLVSVYGAHPIVATSHPHTSRPDTIQDTKESPRSATHAT